MLYLRVVRRVGRDGKIMAATVLCAVITLALAYTITAFNLPDQAEAGIWIIASCAALIILIRGWEESRIW